MPNPQMSEDEEFEFELELEKERGGGGVPQIGVFPDPKELHAANMASERSAYNKALGIGSMGSTLATGTRVAGSLFSNVPIVGALAGGGSEILARGMEYASGAKEAPSLGAAVSESIGPVLANAAIGAIPGGKIAQGIRQGGQALKYSSPVASRYLTGKVIPQAIEGAVIGSGATAASSLAEGQLPSPSNVLTGGAFGTAIGGTVGMVGNRLHEYFAAAPHKSEVRKTDLALARIANALRVPKPEAEKFVKRLRPAMSEVYAHKGPGEWNSVEHLGQAATDTADEYMNKNYDVISNAFKSARASGDAIARNILNLTQGIRPTQDKSYRKSLLAAARAYRGKTFSLDELESFRKTLNDELNAVQKQSGGRMSDIINASPDARIKDAELRGVRDTINRTMDNYANLQEGETAGTLKTFAAIKDLADRSTQRGSEVNLENLERKGTPWSIEHGVDATLRAVGLRQANPAAAAGSTIFSMSGKSRNHPDNLIKSAKRLLDETSLDPAKGGGPHRVLATPLSPRYRPYTGEVVSGGGPGGGGPNQPSIEVGDVPGQIVSRPQLNPQPAQRLLASGKAPVQGQTVPLTIAPVPEPPTALPEPPSNVKDSYFDPPTAVKGSYFGPERRQFDPTVMEDYRKRAVQGGLEKWERRKTIGEIAMTPSEDIPRSQFLRYQGIPEDQIRIDETFERTAPTLRQGSPVQGQTVPLTIKPVPEPKTSKAVKPSHAGLENRQNNPWLARLGSRAAQNAKADPATAQQAVKAHEAGDIDALDSLQQQHGWTNDYLAYGRNPVKRGGVRQP